MSIDRGERLPLGARRGAAGGGEIAVRRLASAALRGVHLELSRHAAAMLEIGRDALGAVVELSFVGVHREARTSARWSVPSAALSRESRLLRWSRQLGSHETTYSASVSRAELSFCAPMAQEIELNLAAKVPPKPQQVSASAISTSSRSRTCPSSSRMGRLRPSSRNA